LLSWLEDKSCVKEVAEKETGTKRYTLTDQGKAFLDEHVKTREELRKRFSHFGPGLGFMGPVWFEFYPEKAKELRKATKGLAVALWNLRDRLRSEYSERAAEEARKALEEATSKIEEITKKMKE
jgi:DNA-binding PadR family transcriptional regulator